MLEMSETFFVLLLYTCFQVSFFWREKEGGREFDRVIGGEGKGGFCSICVASRVLGGA